MLDATTIGKLQAVLGITNLAEVIAAEEEQSIEVPVLFSEEQKNTYGTNRFIDGKKAFGEIFTKDMRTKYPAVGYEGKSAEIFMEKFAEVKVAESGEEPDKKVAKFKAENDELKIKLQESLDSVEGVKAGFEKKFFGMTTNSSIAALIPDKTIIPRSQVLTLFNSEIVTAKDEDGKVFHSRGGEALKDDVGNYKSTKAVVSEFIDSNKFIGTGGMGGGDTDGDSSTLYKSMSSYMDGMEKKGIDTMGEEGQKILAESKKQEDFNVNG